MDKRTPSKRLANPGRGACAPTEANRPKKNIYFPEKDRLSFFCRWRRHATAFSIGALGRNCGRADKKFISINACPAAKLRIAIAGRLARDFFPCLWMHVFLESFAKQYVNSAQVRVCNSRERNRGQQADSPRMARQLVEKDHWASGKSGRSAIFRARIPIAKPSPTGCQNDRRRLADFGGNAWP